MHRTTTNLLGWSGLVMLVALFPFLSVPGYIIQILTLAGIYGIVALGLNIVLGSAGQISLGQAAFFGIGAYTSSQLMIKFGISFWLCLPVAGMLAGLVGLGLGYLALRFHGHYLAMVTLCFGLILQIFFLEFPKFTGGAGGLSDIPNASLMGNIIENSGQSVIKTFHIVWFFILFLLWMVNNLVSSRTGRALASLRDNPIAAQMSGIPIATYKVQAFSLSAVLAGFAGALYSVHTRYIGPEIFGVGASLEFLIMVVVGGLGSPLGAISGALLLAVLPEFMRSYEEYRLLFFGLILMIILVAAPGGIIGLLHSWYRRVTILRQDGLGKTS
jgi:branched-chain amino acid transport system permease protein